MSTRWVLAAVIAALTACSDPSSAPTAVGQLASERVELRAQVTEVLLSRPLDDGATITAATVVATQDATLAMFRVAEAEANVAASRARLEELTNGTRSEQLSAARADYAGAAEQLAFRRAELARQRRLRERGLNSVGDLDAAQASFDQAVASEAAAAARLEELANGTRLETLAQAAADVDAATARLEQRRVELDRHTLSAPSNGRLDRYVVEIGEQVQAGALVAVLLQGPQPKARIYVPAEYRPSLAPGDHVEVSVDGYTDSFAGRVDWVDADAAFTPYFALNERDRSRLSFLAEITLEYDGARLADGLPVTVQWPTK